MPATSQGKVVALAKLQERREAAKTRTPINNDALPAGSPMYFDCLGCATYIAVPESYTSRPRLCGECQALKDLGWLE